MRIRFFTRTQAICLALSLFLGILALGAALGFFLSGEGPQVAAFAPAQETPFLDLMASPAPTAASPAAPTPANLFTFETPLPETLKPTATPSPLPSALPTATLAPGEFHMEVVHGPGQESGSGKKRILIYHTHTFEAYTPTRENTYEPTEEWRTRDNRYNVVRVGEELTALLTAAGFEVTHDTTAYEPPVLSTSYTRSLKMLEDSVARGEKYDLYIDLHRNGASATPANNTVQVGDQHLARMMMLIGDGTGLAGVGYQDKPDWKANMAIAQSITDSLNQQVPGLCRPVELTKNRYNQHIAPCCILIEAGNNRNTLEEVLACVPYLSDAIRSVLVASAEGEAP